MFDVCMSVRRAAAQRSCEVTQRGRHGAPVTMVTRRHKGRRYRRGGGESQRTVIDGLSQRLAVVAQTHAQIEKDRLSEMRKMVLNQKEEL